MEESQKSINDAKQMLFDSFVEQYRALTNFIRKLPFSPQMMQIVLKEFDDGFLWAKEAFSCMQLADNQYGRSDVNNEVEKE